MTSEAYIRSWSWVYLVGDTAGLEKIPDIVQDVDQTFEGDNTVMMQQVAKALIDQVETKAPAKSDISVQDLTNPSSISSLLHLRSARHSLCFSP